MILTNGARGLNYRVGELHVKPFDIFVFIYNLKSHFCVTLSPSFA